jgi:muramoyltetrapeptide carboxypeptidase
MLARTDVDVVMAVRGGYGASRLLDRIDYGLIARSGKILVGHSDFTVLTAAMYAQGKSIGYCGPTAAYDFGAEHVSPYTESHFFQVLENPRHRIEVAAANPYAQVVNGRIWGGNLAMIAHLAGTPFLPRITGGILFVEDINEHPYRIERMIYQLQHAGVLGRQRALILGDFSAYKLQANDNGYDFEAMVAHLRERLPIPVVCGLPFGHVRDKVTIPFGARARLELSRTGFALGLAGYPCMQG